MFRGARRTEGAPGSHRRRRPDVCCSRHHGHRRAVRPDRAPALRACGPLRAPPEPPRSSTCCPVQWGDGNAAPTAFSRKRKCRALPGLPGARCSCQVAGAVSGCVSFCSPLRRRATAFCRAGATLPGAFPTAPSISSSFYTCNYLFRDIILRFLKNVARYLIILSGRIFKSFIAIKLQHCNIHTAWKHTFSGSGDELTHAASGQSACGR